MALVAGRRGDAPSGGLDSRPTAPRFVLVLLPGLTGRELHALAPEVSDAPETLCGLPRPGVWALAGFTSIPVRIDCSRCRTAAGKLLPARSPATR